MQKFKTLPLQIAAKSFQISPEFSSQMVLTRLRVGFFEILKIEILTLLFVFVNIGPNG